MSRKGILLNKTLFQSKSSETLNFIKYLTVHTSLSVYSPVALFLQAIYMCCLGVELCRIRWVEHFRFLSLLLSPGCCSPYSQWDQFISCNWKKDWVFSFEIMTPRLPYLNKFIWKGWLAKILWIQGRLNWIYRGKVSILDVCLV